MNRREINWDGFQIGEIYKTTWLGSGNYCNLIIVKKTYYFNCIKYTYYSSRTNKFDYFLLGQNSATAKIWDFHKIS